ncbi:MAG: efflux RND transporter periplasmic adaptor subunit [Clostridia bacterium]|nr:efflux RND transporter periplasmic adaptor subunit [Clostridia bacterium]
MGKLPRKYLCFIIAWIIIAGNLLAGCGILPEEEEALAPPLVKPKRTEYELYKVERKDISKTLTGSGNLIAVDEETLYFTASGGKLEKIEVKLSEAVKKGQVLARLDTGNLESQIRKQKNMVEKIRIQLESQKALYDKYTSVPGGGLLTPKEAQDMKTSLNLQQIDLENAKIELEEFNNQLKKANMTSPIDGIITFIEDLKPGDSVEAYKKVVTVSDPSKLQIYYQPSQSVNDIKVGMRANVKYKDSSYQGEVILCPDNAPKDALEKYKNAIVIKANDLPEGVKWGEFVDFTIEVQSKKDVLTVPKKALKRLVGRTFVQVMDGSSKKEYDVKVGIESDYEAEILSGVKEGQTVILN